MRVPGCLLQSPPGRLQGSMIFPARSLFARPILHDLACTNDTNSTISASVRHDPSRTNGTNHTISAKRKTRSFLHEWHEQHDFRKRKHDLSCHSCLKNRVIDLSISYHSCHSCSQKIVSSTCRHRIIRAIRASKNRAIDLSISCHSCHSCSKKIVSSTCRYRIIRVIRALKYRVIDWSISCHSCLKISCHRLVDIVAFVSFVQDGIETFVPTKP